MLVNGTNEICSNVHRVLGQSFAVLLEARDGKVSRLRLVWVKQQLHTMNGRVTPSDLSAPGELGGIILVVENEGRNFGLAVSLVSLV